MIINRYTKAGWHVIASGTPEFRKFGMPTADKWLTATFAVTDGDKLATIHVSADELQGMLDAMREQREALG